MNGVQQLVVWLVGEGFALFGFLFWVAAKYGRRG